AKYVEAHGAGIGNVINLDINGYGDTVVYGDLKQPTRNAALRQRLVETCAANDVPCVGLAEMPPGDDRSFSKAGIPTISMGILPGLEVHQLWLLLQGGKESGLVPGTVPAIFRTIHTPEDRSDKIDPRAMERVFDLVLALVRR